LVLIIACSAFAADKTAATPKYDAKFAEQYLKETQKNFLDSFKGLSEAQLKSSPHPIAGR